jgi:hypothetical protein
MSVPDLLEDLGRQGARVWVEGGRLRYSGPRSAIRPGILAQLKTHKPEIVRMLGGLEVAEGAENAEKDEEPDGRRMPPKVDGVYVHRGECGCEWCSSEHMPPRYVDLPSPEPLIRSEEEVFGLAREYFGEDDKQGVA